MKAYIASGWFNDRQEKARQEILKACENKINVYSPKEDGLFTPEKNNAIHVFDENIEEILSVDMVIASTEGKDMGTIFECGIAYANYIPIVYYFKGEGKFNLMLANSGIAVLTTFKDLQEYIDNVKMRGEVINVPYLGDQE